MRKGRPTNPLRPIDLTPEEGRALREFAKFPGGADLRSCDAEDMADRARIILACGKGLSLQQAAREVGLSYTRVKLWRARFVAAPAGRRLASLDPRPDKRGSRPPPAALVEAIRRWMDYADFTGDSLTTRQLAMLIGRRHRRVARLMAQLRDDQEPK